MALITASCPVCEAITPHSHCDGCKFDTCDICNYPCACDDFRADSHADLDAGECGMMADADYYDQIHASLDVWSDEDRQATAKAENDAAADDLGPEA